MTDQKAWICVELQRREDGMDLRTFLAVNEPDATCEELFPDDDDPELRSIWMVETTADRVDTLLTGLVAAPFVRMAERCPGVVLAKGGP
jgi:hypothetical protein